MAPVRTILKTYSRKKYGSRKDYVKSVLKRSFERFFVVDSLFIIKKFYKILHKTNLNKRLF